MADPIRFFFDEHMPSVVVNALRRRGADVLTVHEAGRRGFPDDEQLRFATAVGRSIVTFDVDFLTLASEFLTAGAVFAGIVYCSPGVYEKNPRRLIRDLTTLHGVYTVDDMQNYVEYL